MLSATTCLVRISLVAAITLGCATSVHADPLPYSLGAVYAYGDNVDVYGIQGAWAPRTPNQALAQYNLEFRVASEIGYWKARDHYEHDSLWYGNVMADTRWVPWRTPEIQGFLEIGLGIHLISHVQIANHNLATAFNFGSEGAAGLAFGDNG